MAQDHTRFRIIFSVPQCFPLDIHVYIVYNVYIVNNIYTYNRKNPYANPTRTKSYCHPR